MFLKENIIDQGYDGKDFTKFMTTYKDDGDDIDEWELDELEDIVEEFKRFATPSQTPVQKPANEGKAQDPAEPELLVQPEEISKSTGVPKDLEYLIPQQDFSKVEIKQAKTALSSLRDFKVLVSEGTVK